MMFGRSRFGWGGRGGGWGKGNPYPYCRVYPWLPRWWWAQGAGPYGAGEIYPSHGGWWCHPHHGLAPYAAQITREQEVGFLKEEAKAIKGRLDEIEATLKELEEVRE